MNFRSSKFLLVDVNILDRLQGWRLLQVQGTMCLPLDTAPTHPLRTHARNHHLRLLRRWLQCRGLVLSDRDLDRDDSEGLRDGRPLRVRRPSATRPRTCDTGSRSMTYGLRRGNQWICAPPGHDPAVLVPWPIFFEQSSACAWRSSSLELALRRRDLLLNCWGWSSQVERIHGDSG